MTTIHMQSIQSQSKSGNRSISCLSSVIMTQQPNWRRLLQQRAYGMKFETWFQVMAGLAITAGFVVIPATMNRQFEIRQEALLGGLGDQRSNVLNQELYNLRMKQRAELLGDNKNIGSERR